MIDNLFTFFSDHFGTMGTRHGEDQNVVDAVLTMLVDKDMVEDRLIKAAAELIGQRWHTIKAAVVRRAKVDSEEAEGRHGVWTRRARSSRCDKFDLPGLNAFCHDDNFFKFSSRHSQPMRKHIGLREYEARCDHRVR